MRIAIVEDNKTLLENLRLLLQGEPGFSVTGAWQSAEEALSFPSWAEMDLLVADLDLPGMSGVELIGRLKAKHPHVQCMAYTISEDSATMFAALRAGACGYLLKGSTPRELIEGLQSLHNGGAPMSPKIARRVILQIQESAGGITGSPVESLTQREQHVLQEVERGLSYKEVGMALGISPQTVHVHIKNVYEKLHCHTRSEALRKARQIGLI